MFDPSPSCFFAQRVVVYGRLGSMLHSNLYQARRHEVEDPVDDDLY